MNQTDFEQFILQYGKDILRFCRVVTLNQEAGDELYQDTMVRMLEKSRKLTPDGNAKSYALSVAMLLWKNHKKKYARHMRLAPSDSMDELHENGVEINSSQNAKSPEETYLEKARILAVQQAVSELPDKYSLPVYLFYSADMQIHEIADYLGIPEGTVKTRLHTAKKLLKKKLEAMGYDR